jgi:hypothetical protein
MLYLRQFKQLELVNLAGNPLCREANYKSYLCSHIKNLKYLDYVRVKADDIAAAMEQHQDEMLDLREKEEIQEEEERAKEAARKEAKLMQEANIAGIDTLFEDLTKSDADWAKLAQVLSLSSSVCRISCSLQNSFVMACCSDEEVLAMLLRPVHACELPAIVLHVLVYSEWQRCQRPAPASRRHCRPHVCSLELAVECACARGRSANLWCSRVAVYWSACERHGIFLASQAQQDALHSVSLSAVQNNVVTLHIQDAVQGHLVSMAMPVPVQRPIRPFRIP